ncbi:MAG: CHAT domain-containing tetratricopeptide repeat protein, partial [Burkholderiaceae bacterium]
YEAVLAHVPVGTSGRLRLLAQTELVVTYQKLGRLGEAAAAGELALQEQAQPSKALSSIFMVLLDNLAGAYLDLGRIDDAIAMQQRANAMYMANYGPDHEGTLTARSNLANVLLSAGRIDESIAISRDVVRRRQAMPEAPPRNALISRNTLASSLIEAGQFEEAEQELRAVVPLWEQKFGPKDPDALNAQYYLAIVAWRRGQPEEAKRQLEQVCRTFDEISDTYEGAPRNCPMRLAVVMWQLGERQAAAQKLGDALEKFERRAETGGLSEHSQQAFFAERVPEFRRWAEWLIVLGDASKAFTVSEHLRGRTLLQSIVLRHADASPLLPSETTAHLTDLKSELVRLDEVASHAEDPAAKALISAQRDTRFRELVSLRAALRERYPAYAALTEVRTVTPEEAARALPAATAAITYLMGDTHLYALVIAPGRRLTVTDLGPIAGLRQQVDAAVAMMAHDATRRVWRHADGSFNISAQPPSPTARELRDWRELARELGNRLLAPLASQLRPYRHWIIVPDGALAQLPFEALMLAGKPVLDRADVHYVQSVSILVAMQSRSQRTNSSMSLLSVGAPDFPQRVDSVAADSQVRVDAGAYVRGAAGDPTATRRAFEYLGLQWGPLPGAAAEIEKVRAVFAGRGLTLTLTGAQASETNLQRLNARGELLRYQYLHFATHGYLNTSAPALSAIVLSPTNVTAAADGYLTAAELPAYRFDSELIVLSACETGRGAELAGEGIMGLPFALFIAGNRSAVLTLWKVVDASSARFVSRFFERVAQGIPAVSALAQTKREFLRDSRTAEPLHWAAFVLYGR